MTWTTSFYSTDFPAHVDKMHEERDKLFEIEYSVSGLHIITTVIEIVRLQITA